MKEYQKQYASGEMGMEAIERSLYSWLGHAEYGNTYGLRSKMIEGFVLSRSREQKSEEVM